MAITLAAMFAVGLYLVLLQPSLGWDEAVYASKARSIVTDAPASQWAIYRPPGLPLLGAAVVPIGFSDVAVRTVSLVLGLGALAALAVLGRVVWGAATALVALLGAASVPVVIRELFRFHNDLASTGALLALMALLWYELERRPAPDRRLLLAGALAAAAFYLRYGTLVALAGIAVATVLLWPGTLRRHWRMTLATVGLAVLLAVPYLVLAVRETGDVLGIVRLAAEQVATSDAVTAVLVYARSLPRVLAGPLGLAYLAAAAVLLVASVVALLRGRLDRGPGRGLAFLVIPAGIAAVGLVVVSHAEPRYMLFPLLLGILLGAEALVRGAGLVLRHAPPRLGTRLPVVAAWVVLVAVTGVLVVREVRSLARFAAPDAAWIAETGRWIGEDARAPCVVVTTLVPTLGWYSGCRAAAMGSADARAAMADASRPTYLVFTTLDDRRRTAAAIAASRALVGSSPAAELGTSGAGAQVFRVAP